MLMPLAVVVVVLVFCGVSCRVGGFRRCVGLLAVECLGLGGSIVVRVAVIATIVVMAMVVGRRLVTLIVGAAAGAQQREQGRDQARLVQIAHGSPLRNCSSMNDSRADCARSIASRCAARSARWASISSITPISPAA